MKTDTTTQTAPTQEEMDDAYCGTSPRPRPTPTMRDPKRWAVFTWFADNGLPPPVESEISDLLDRIERASDNAQSLDAAWAAGYQEAVNARI